MKRIFKSTALLLLTLVLTASLFSCTVTKKKYSDTVFDVFDSFASITVYEASKSDYEVYLEVFKAKAFKYHHMFDIYNEYEGEVNLCTINNNASNAPVEISGDMMEFLEYATHMNRVTSGYTSITVGALTSVWKTAIKEGVLPEQETLDEAAKHIDISLLELDLISRTAYFHDSELKLDAGALAKGYAANEISNALIEAGCESFLIDIGGTVCGFGQKRNFSNWTAGIKSPTSDKDIGVSINISGKALSTSGSYQRKANINGVTYHHIINPFTKYPENNFLSVSVICSSAADADALSTALFSMTQEEGLALANTLGFEAVWINADESIITTQGIDIQ
ncbi:MAG: FAD:protein FMN transferase [Clostridia bacterium]|nr:FAD:protein FMN transferase [Clostridia bacterium]